MTCLCFISQEQVCCPDGQIIPSSSPTARKCCARTSYDERTHVCCNNVVTPRASGDRSECCGDKAYNPVQQVCCAPGYIVPHYAPGAAGAKCCANASFNHRTHICCNNTVTLKVGGDRAGCCGAISYNTFTQVSMDTSRFVKGLMINK